MHQPNRYDRQTRLAGFGPEAQQKLQQARVLVVGAGGLGVPALQYLAGMGVGEIGIVDDDTVSLTNLQRQVLYFESELGQPKAEVAAAKLAQLNSSITLTPYTTRLTVANALEIIGKYDLVLDATDNFETRYLLNDACVLLGKPLVYGAVQAFEGQVAVFNHLDGPTYRCLYPEPPSPDEIPDCNAAGVLGVVPGLIGCRQALEAVKVLTGVGEPLSGALLIFDFLRNEQFKLKLKARPENKTLTKLQPDYSMAACASVASIAAQELLAWYTAGKAFYVLDVREPQEFAAYHLPDAHLVPLQTLDVQVPQLPRHLPLVVVCERGSRSQKAAQIVQQAPGHRQVLSLSGGLHQWKKEFGTQLLC